MKKYLFYQSVSLRRYKVVALREVEIPFFRGFGRQRGRRFGALAQVIGRTEIPFLRKYIVPAAKRVGADFLEFPAPEIAGVVSGRKNFKSVGSQTLRKHRVVRGASIHAF